MTWTEEVLLSQGIWDPKLKILCATIPLKGMGGPIYDNIYSIYKPFQDPVKTIEQQSKGENSAVETGQSFFTEHILVSRSVLLTFLLQNMDWHSGFLVYIFVADWRLHSATKIEKLFGEDKYSWICFVGDFFTDSTRVFPTIEPPFGRIFLYFF